MPVATSPRRKTIVAILLALAIAGAFLRAFADNPSTLRDVGTLLLVMWVPAIGNIIGYFGRKIPLPAPKLAFDEGSAFVSQLLVELTPLDPQPVREPDPMQPPGPELFTLIIGREGFTARPRGTVDEALRAKGPREVEIELLNPARALPRFEAGTEFRVAIGRFAVAKGRALRALAQPPGA